MRGRRSFVVLGSCAAASVALTAAPALRADDALARCVSAAEEAQHLRKNDKLLDARARLTICSDQACPDIIRRDCSRWQETIERELPRVTFRATDSRAREVGGVRVFVDGALVADGVDGAAVAVDPGEHAVLFVAKAGVSREVRATLRQGEFAQVGVTFAEELRADGTRESTGPVTRFGAPADAFVELGVGVLALANFGVFEALWQTGYHHLRTTCGQTRACTDAEIDPVRTNYVVARVSLGVAAVALGVAAWRFFTASGSRRPVDR
jgi:hypothetical protein